VKGAEQAEPDILRGKRVCAPPFAKETPLSASSTKPGESQVRAEASFRKEERAKDGAKAMMEYQANARIAREKMAQLKALRLAKEAAEEAAEQAPKAVSKPASKPAPKLATKPATKPAAKRATRARPV
jgi:hypothetical protein